MQYTLTDLLQADQIVLDLQAADAEGVIRSLVDRLAANGAVTSAYADDVIAREQTFPTGLPTEPLAVAIPHADPPQVLRSAIGLAVLAQPVAFGQMGTDGSTQVQTRLVFLLAIKEQEKQVEMIGQLIGAIQNPGLLEGLTQAASPVAALQLIRETLQP
ncbi:MAG: PTS sugar transporter subunit IIA [Anaerolineales bacterium]|nr:PTS sugar transporter subunit IIA [Anaerolineales bacterium]